MKLYLTVVLLCISLMTNGVEHLFLSLLTICISSLEKCLFKSFDCFWIVDLLLLLLLSFQGSRYSLDIWVANIFFLFCGLSFSSLLIVSWCIDVLSFDELQFVCFFFYCQCFGVIAKISLPNLTSWRFSPMLSSKGFTVLALTFRSLRDFQVSLSPWTCSLNSETD